MLEKELQLSVWRESELSQWREIACGIGDSWEVREWGDSRSEDVVAETPHLQTALPPRKLIQPTACVPDPLVAR
jgi:hypothetical protein